MTELAPPQSSGPVEPPALARIAARELVVRRGMRLTHPSDSRLGELASGYDLGVAIWTGDRSAFVGFYTPPPDPIAAGQDLAARCDVARRWGHGRLAAQGSQRCDILLVALGPVAGSLTPPPPGDLVLIGAISVGNSGEVTELVAPPKGLPTARELRGYTRALQDGAAAPTVAAIDVAERETVGTGVRGRARATFSQTAPILTYSLIGLWVGIWLLEHVVVQQTSCPPQFSGYECFSAVSPDDFGTFFVNTPGSEQWWRWFASGFVHDFDTPLHVGFNSLAMWQIGRFIEPLYGKMVLIGTLLAAILAGDLMVVLLSDAGIYSPGGGVLGASGGICGLIGVMLVMGHVQGRQMPPAFAAGIRKQALFNAVFIMGYSLFLGSFIAWPAHLGGILGGALIGLILPPRHAVGGRDLSLIEKIAIGALVAVTVVALAFAAAHVVSVIQGSP